MFSVPLITGGPYVSGNINIIVNGQQMYISSVVKAKLGLCMFSLFSTAAFSCLNTDGILMLMFLK